MKNLLKISFFVYIISIFIIPSVSFAFPNQEITFYDNGEPTVDLSGNSISHFRSNITISGTCGSGGGEYGIATTSFNAINNIIGTGLGYIFVSGCNATSSVSYWTCNIYTNPYCGISYANRYNHTESEEIAYGTAVIVNGIFQGETIPSTLTRIDSFTYSTTTQKFNIQGYFNATSTTDRDYLSVTSYNNIYGVQLLYSLNAYATSTRNFNIDIPFVIYTTNNTGTSTAPINNNTDVIADISRIDGINYTITTLASSTLSFTASTTGSVPLENIDDILNYPEQECSITNVIGCIKNAFIWAFWPTKGSFTQFSVFTGVLESKAPTGYFYVVRDNLLGISTSTTPTFNIVIPTWLKNTFFDPIDTSVAGLLWFGYLVWLYKRFKIIQL